MYEVLAKNVCGDVNFLLVVKRLGLVFHFKRSSSEYNALFHIHFSIEKSSVTSCEKPDLKSEKQILQVGQKCEER